MTEQTPVRTLQLGLPDDWGTLNDRETNIIRSVAASIYSTAFRAGQQAMVDSIVPYLQERDAMVVAQVRSQMDGEAQSGQAMAAAQLIADAILASAPIVTVNVPEPKAKKITRDRAGNITGIEPAK